MECPQRRDTLMRAILKSDGKTRNGIRWNQWWKLEISFVCNRQTLDTLFRFFQFPKVFPEVRQGHRVYCSDGTSFSFSTLHFSGQPHPSKALQVLLDYYLGIHFLSLIPLWVVSTSQVDGSASFIPLDPVPMARCHSRESVCRENFCC